MDPTTIDQSFQIALQHQRAGRLPEAEQLYRQILARQPTYAPALHYLGLLGYRAGRYQAAADLIRRAIASNPNDARPYNNLGRVLLDMGRPDEAMPLCRTAISLMPNLAEAHYNLGSALHARGQLDEAITAYRRAISLKSDMVEAYNNLGNALKDKGQLDESIAALRKAIKINPRYHQAHANLGLALQASGKFAEAIASYRLAIALKPDLPDIYSNLGNALRAAGQVDQAIAAYQQAIARKPNYPEAYSNLGNVWLDKGDLDKAIASYRQAIELKPNHPDAYNNLANTLKERGQLEEAIAAYRQAISLKPDMSAAYSNLGNALRDLGQLDESISAYRQAISLTPNYPEAYSNLGNALKDKGRMEEAIAAYRQAIALKPNYGEAYSNLGNALQARGQLDEAIAACREAITLKPTFAAAHSNLGGALADKGQLDEAIAACRAAIALKPELAEAHYNLGNALIEQGRPDEAIASYRQAIVVAPDNPVPHSNLILALHYHPSFDASAIAAELRQWSRRHAEPLRQNLPPHTNDRSPTRRLRIGYLSPRFCMLPEGRFLLPLIQGHDRTQVEIFCYSDCLKPDSMTGQIRKSADGWRDIAGQPDQDVADLIRRDEIDIAVDLMLHGRNNRLRVFARKPAPIQVSYLAYCSSTGLDTMDYRLSDPYLDPPGQDEAIYSEITVRLPETYWCYQPFNTSLEVGPLPALQNLSISFGCLNNFCKVNELMLGMWAEILRAVPDSKLLLHAREGSHRQRVIEQMKRDGVEPNRVQFVGKVPIEKYFELYRQIDIALDTSPYCGGTTACDAVWMGVPVVGLIGKTAVGRGGLSILSNVGLPELAGSSPEQYAQIAVALANDLPRLSIIRSTLRRRMEQSPLMDAPRFIANVEAAYRNMWQSYVRNSQATPDSRKY